MPWLKSDMINAIFCSFVYILLCSREETPGNKFMRSIMENFHMLLLIYLLLEFEIVFMLYIIAASLCMILPQVTIFNLTTLM
jgi:hypothetical protein